MSEYMERHTVSKLIGSPPGYIGYGETGTLTEAVRRKPFTVVLLDEIEKAHPDIFNILLQIFEDGHLADSQGRRVSFKNTLIVMTSNVGSTSISDGRRSIGFSTDDTESSTYIAMKTLVMEELKAFFRPELLNRIDEMVVFRPLEETQMLAILDIILQELKGKLLALGIGLEVSDAMKSLICQEGYDKSYGARPLRRAVTQLMEDVISEAILFGEYKPGDTILVDTNKEGKPCLSRLNQQIIQVSDPTRTF
jgi:ATP-dependent Clp protease ATP-binding subunit ClpC